MWMACERKYDKSSVWNGDYKFSYSDVEDAEAAVSSTCHASMCFLFGIGTMCVVWCEGIRQSEFAYGKAHDHIANTCQAMTQE